MNNNFKIWYHPYFGFTSIHAMIQEYSDIMINEYDKSKVDINEINIIPFFWENGNQIGIPFIVNTDKFIEILKELNDLNFFVFADFSTEVLQTLPVSNRSIQGIDELALYNVKNILIPNFNFKRFFLVCNDSTNTSLGKIKYKNINLNTMYIPYFVLSTPMYMKKYVNDIDFYKNLEIKKDFLCLNRRIRYPKFIFLKTLWKLGLLDKTYWTWVSSYLPKDLFENDEFLKDIGVDYYNSTTIQLDDDVMYGAELDRADEYLYTINPKWYYETKVNLIVETYFYLQPIHITEKTIKPIYLGVPFVIFASKNHLNKLKEMGFDVFEKIIGTYDCTSPKSVIDAGIRLSKVYDTDEVFEICKYNKDLIRNHDFLKKLFETTFINSIKTLKETNKDKLI
jgi:hypothetical protein